jgi:hypothetical protein
MMQQPNTSQDANSPRHSGKPARFEFTRHVRR